MLATASTRIAKYTSECSACRLVMNHWPQNCERCGSGRLFAIPAAK